MNKDTTAQRRVKERRPAEPEGREDGHCCLERGLPRVFQHRAVFPAVGLQKQ